MKKILLVAPDFNPGDTKLKGVYASFPYKESIAPLGLATVAALTPDDIELDIWDEAVHGLVGDSTNFKKEYDLVGVTGYAAHIVRLRELGQIFRRRGIPVAVGGPGVSAAPEVYRDYFDILFIGEAEYTWPRFIADWRAGNHRSEYRQVAKVDMSHSPLPRWDHVAADMNRYSLGAVQTTRGCPYDCEFCDVIYIYGRQARHKSVDQVLEEVSVLERLGVANILLCDDNFIGNPRYGKALLKELIPVNNSFRHPVGFFTQITLNVAKDDEMLELLADANFTGLFIGVETPNVDSLIEANKPQNYKTDIVADIKKIQSYGLPVNAGMIVGFDHDDTTIFDHQFEFLQESCIATIWVNMLSAPVGTKLWVRLHKEGRVLDLSSGMNSSDDTFLTSSRTNIIPKQMTRLELLSGYRGLVERVRDWRNFEARIKGMVSEMRHQPKVRQRQPSWQMRLKAIKFFLSMDRQARWPVLRLLLYTRRRAPFMLNKVMGLIMRQYNDAARLPLMLETIDEGIRLETAEGFKLQREQTVFFVPEAFRKPYGQIFPELYERVYRGLSDKSRTHNALVEVIYDFLTRWGLTFEQFEEHHQTFLLEISDRTIAKENSNVQTGANEQVIAGEAPDEMGDLTQGQVAIRLNRLADEVLRVVEQDLRSGGPQSPDAALEPVVVG